MKHLVKDGKVILSGIPSHFRRSNGQEFWGGYEDMKDLHYEDGWRDEFIPVYDHETQQLGELYYDQATDKCTYKVIARVIDIEFEKDRLNAELSSLSEEFALLITKVKLANDPEPGPVTMIIPQIRAMYGIAKDEISALTELNVRSYVLRGPQVEQAINLLKSYL